MLDKIIDYKKHYVTERLAEFNSYKNLVKPSTKDFYQALKNSPTSFICEIKLASPSQGPIKRDADISYIARIYAPFATAMSVVADEKFFMGSPDFVKKISSEQACPILFKDFIVSPEQVYQARFCGADCVLLMLSVLDNKTYQECELIAKQLNMSVLCEVHSPEELYRAIALKAQIIGINNRNLQTLEVDLSTTERLLNLAPKDALKNVVIISESGFYSHAQILAYKTGGRIADPAQVQRPAVKGFLVGTSLMRSNRVDLAVRELIFGRVKICGLTNIADARLSYECGAYYGGLNFSENSPRRISLEEAAEIVNAVPLSFGGVFVNQPIDELVNIASKLKLDFVQLHGDEAQDYIKQLRPLLPTKCQIWQAHRVKDHLVFPPSDSRENASTADILLFDKFSEKAYGGTGKSFDWSLLKEIPGGLKFGLAGGITNENIREAEKLCPTVIDIASGVEDADPRRKSAVKLREIFMSLRG